MSIPIQSISTTFPKIFVDGQEIDDAVTILFGATGSIVYDAWQEVSIAKSLESLSGSFQIQLVDKWRPENVGSKNARWPFQPGEPVHIKIGKYAVTTGYIYRTDVSIRNDQRLVRIVGRDKTGDLVDASAFIPNQSLEFKNIDIVTLAKTFATPLDIKVSVASGVDIGERFEKFTVKPGETIFSALERAAKLRGLLLISDEFGDLVITSRSGGDIGEEPSVQGQEKTKDVFGRTKAPSVQNLVKSFNFKPGVISGAKADVDLVQGENILEAQASFDHSDRFQTYIVKGQSQGTDVFNRINTTGVTAASFDQAITRNRFKVIVADGSIDKTAAQKRANWEAIVRATKSVDVTVTVQGWLQTPKGRIWAVNELVRLESGFLGIKSDIMLITSVTFQKSTSGTFTTLKLTRPDAYNTKNDTLTVDSDPSSDLGWTDPGIATLADRVKNIAGS